MADRVLSCPAIPTGILVYQAYSQLKWEAFHQHRVLAEELAARIDARIVQLVDAEEARSFADYAFLNVAGDPAASFLQRSPLSAYPPASAIPGLIGYFQVDARRRIHDTAAAAGGDRDIDYGISAGELEQRLALQQQIGQILSRNRLVQAASPDRVTSGAAGADALQATEARRDRPAGAPARRSAWTRTRRSDRPWMIVPCRRRAERAEQPVPGQAAFDRLNKAAVPRAAEAQQAASSARPGRGPEAGSSLPVRISR